MKAICFAHTEVMTDSLSARTREKESEVDVMEDDDYEMTFSLMTKKEDNIWYSE